jgi:hypothetical protein
MRGINQNQAERLVGIEMREQTLDQAVEGMPDAHVGPGTFARRNTFRYVITTARSHSATARRQDCYQARLT